MLKSTCESFRGSGPSGRPCMSRSRKVFALLVFLRIEISELRFFAVVQRQRMHCACLCWKNSQYNASMSHFMDWYLSFFITSFDLHATDKCSQLVYSSFRTLNMFCNCTGSQHWYEVTLLSATFHIGCTGRLNKTVFKRSDAVKI